MSHATSGLVPCLHYVCNEIIFRFMEMKTDKACFGRDLRVGSGLSAPLAL